jgi:hypothetical protein
MSLKGLKGKLKFVLGKFPWVSTVIFTVGVFVGHFLQRVTG